MELLSFSYKHLCTVVRDMILCFITAAKQSCGKVTFSQACVSHSVHRGIGHVWQKGACVAGETATAADGTHPTGMHSSYQSCSLPALLMSWESP